ncbi:nucleotidyltransferase family protein [Alkaliphilus serpentinus]|uniref:Nucleotidyl transferase domain-containing protein n=1 Tax=Alkaliphilus serpentinus TaxID=1482731 RepID=A0A833MA12_9FIRM|nr:sugar phosphate nucleotidyltransferase [Alkaliphilus serpentinus]KAB3529848.1 hypothetical protein F8153_08600 [Alkaliphilus serpentinus]
MIDVILLVGGEGKRLREITKNRLPKPMVKIEGIPFLRYKLDEIINEMGDSINKIILAIGYLGDMIVDYFGYNYRGINIIYSNEGNDKLGTGGALKKASELIETDIVLVGYGDVFCSINLNEMIKVHSKVTILTTKYRPDMRFGRLRINQENKVTDFIPKGNETEEEYIDGGLYLFNKEVLRIMPIYSQLDKVLEKYILEGEVLAYKVENIFFDIGTPKDFDVYVKYKQHEIIVHKDHMNSAI